MENVKICEIRQGSRSNYPHLISKDEKYLFCCSHQLGDHNFRDKMFCIHRPSNKAFYAELTDEEVHTRFNFLPDEWSFEQDGHEYIARKNDVFQKFRILDKMLITPGWDWRKPLGRNQIYPLWNPDISRPADRAGRVKDLQLIFKRGEAYEVLERCNEMLLICSEIPVLFAAHNKGLSSKTKVAIYEPFEVVPEEAPPVGFNDKYRRILMAVKTKPFVLLAGISGIGKSRLVRTLAYKTCFLKELQHPDKPGNFELIKVKPDWHDSSELIGYTTQRSDSLRYNVTAFIRFIVKAWRYKQVPFFLCLDEMNLARVEQYFAEYLSILETRRFHDGQMFSDAFISNEDILLYSSEDPLFWVKMGLENEDVLQQQFLLSGITLPPNLVVAGTVNMDETTHVFSRKVLDRAMTIEMDEVNMRDGFEVWEDEWKYPETFVYADLLKGSIHDANDVYHNNLDLGLKVIKELENINSALVNSPFRFAYRVRNEVLIYCAYNEELAPPKTTLVKWFYICLDEMILMKILSRIEGSEKKCGSVIKNLLEKITNKFPESYRKLKQMQYQLTNTGYTSFWN